MDIAEKQKYLFGHLFLLANKLQVAGDQHLAPDDMTIRQWFLIATIVRFGEEAPTLNEVAESMGSTRQNVRQLVDKLTEKGFIKIDKDENDARALRLKLTEKNAAFWEGRDEKDGRFITELFQGLTDDEINMIFEIVNKLLVNLKKIGKNS
jgi:DNA-binding MarR family transcriptional regulator